MMYCLPWVQAGKKTSEARVKAKERSQDGKKIQDLERQVKIYRK